MADGEQASSAVRVAGTVVLGLVILIVLFLWRAGGAFESELLGPAKAPAVVKAEKKMKQKAEVVKQPSPQVACATSHAHNPLSLPGTFSFLSLLLHHR